MNVSQIIKILEKRGENDFRLDLIKPIYEQAECYFDVKFLKDMEKELFCTYVFYPLFYPIQ